MKRNKFKLSVLLRKRVLRNRFLKKKMKYIGKIYRASKGQFVQNKLIAVFFNTHFKWILKTNVMLYSTYWKYLNNQNHVLSTSLKIFGNPWKFEKHYYSDEMDENYLFIFRKYISRNKYKPIMFAAGVSYLPIHNSLVANYVEPTNIDFFFEKASFTFFSNELLTNHILYELDWNLQHHINIYFNLTIFNLCKYVILNKLYS